MIFWWKPKLHRNCVNLCTQNLIEFSDSFDEIFGFSYEDESTLKLMEKVFYLFNKITWNRKMYRNYWNEWSFKDMPKRQWFLQNLFDLK